MRRLAPWLLLAALALLVLFFRSRYSGSAPAREGCDASLWKRVYRPARLRVLAPCTAIEGRVAAVSRAEDGDVHIDLDPDDAAVLNLVNVLHGRARLPVEIVCDHEPSEADTKRICEGYVSRVAIPRVGDRIRAIGAYVKDRENGWNEIHPAARIEPAP